MWLILSWAMSWFFSFADFRGFWELRRGVWRHDDERAENDWLRTRMGVYAEGNYKVEEYTGRAPRATIQLWRLHDALHVSISTTFGFCICQHLITCSSYFFLAFLWYCFSFFFFSKKSVYRTIYNMCTQKPPHDYSQQLYDKYRESFEEYISATVGTWYCCNPNISVKCTLLIASELSLICL